MPASRSNSPSKLRLATGLLLASVLSLFARAWLEQSLTARGMEPNLAGDLSFLVVPLILVIVAGPVFLAEKDHLREILGAHRLSVRLVLEAALLGLLLRLAFWLSLLMQVSWGMTPGAGLSAPELSFTFSCPPAVNLMLALAVWTVLVPATEEIVHRGLILNWLLPRGRWVAVVVSSLAFTLLHTPSSMLFVFAISLVLGWMLIRSHSLWVPMIAHSTYDTLIIFDWRCLNGTWIPAPEQDNLTALGGLFAVLLATVAATILFRLIRLGPKRSLRAQTD